ncbi:MAG: DDE-type integrase/transposase/recombinase [Oscillospiraceae bacterium]|nr:DDE-type integrase/transposase/recombinase [Oscillospiraceae bacterium]
MERIERARQQGDNHAVSRISGYYLVAVKTAYDWQYKWDGGWQSLVVKSHRPHGHPRAHTETEIQLMITVTRECGFLPPLLMCQELCERVYRRSYGGMKRFFRKHFASPTAPLVRPKKPEAYDGGKYPGERVQINVKYVPKASLYQYTLTDEYSRWCYREIYAEHNDYASNLFLRNAIRAAPFKIRMAQTDNGFEFTNALTGQKREKLTRFELALTDFGMAYRRIRVGTPKHNGRVERQHGLDMLRFYKRLRFSSLEDAMQKVAAYNAWSNTRIKSCLGFRSPVQTIALHMLDFFHSSLTTGQIPGKVLSWRGFQLECGLLWGGFLV